jgi:DNA processing protein
MARAVWSGLAEPGDAVAGALVATLGAIEALELVRSAASGAQPVPKLALAGATAERVARSVAGWAQRLDAGQPDAHLAWFDRLGGRVVVPNDPQWPPALDDLGAARPMCLWVRGRSPGEVLERAVGLVGARAASAYGEHVAAELAAALADSGVTVVSGGAFGIDAAAHRGALAAGGPSVAVLAGGLDRPYPAGNARLLGALAENGALISEVPPGRTPTRHRFLLRNRVIAAVTQATVVVEAAWRSGALSTAGHALQLFRPVGAVPGPVTSASSAGCHRLLREGATCVTDAAEVLELIGGPPADRDDQPISTDGLDDAERLVFEALPAWAAAAASALTRPAGLALPDVLAALGRLEMLGLVSRGHGRWQRVTSSRH